MVFIFISQNLNFWMLDIDNKNNETSWIFELIFKKSTLWTKNWICNTHFNIVFEFWSKQTVKQIFCLTLSVGVVDVPKTHKTMQNNGRIIVIFDLKTPVINRSGAKYVQGVRMVPQGLLLLELWLLFNWEVESQTIGAMGRINGQVIFPYVPVAHCLAFRLNFIGMNEMNWNTTYSIHYSKNPPFVLSVHSFQTCLELRFNYWNCMIICLKRVSIVNQSSINRCK